MVTTIGIKIRMTPIQAPLTWPTKSVAPEGAPRVLLITWTTPVNKALPDLPEMATARVLSKPTASLKTLLLIAPLIGMDLLETVVLLTRFRFDVTALLTGTSVFPGITNALLIPRLPIVMLLTELLGPTCPVTLGITPTNVATVRASPLAVHLLSELDNEKTKTSNVFLT